MTALAILGAGGHGRVVADSAAAAGWSPIRFFDDRPDPPAGLPWPVTGRFAQLLEDTVAESTKVIVAIGDNSARLTHHRRVTPSGLHLATVIHPGSVVSPFAKIGDGSVVMAGAVINIGCILGEAVIVNTGSVVDHDCRLGDGVHISPGAILAGGVSIGAESWIGAGAVVREGIVIGSRCRIGAGAVVIKPVGDGETVVGNPARPLER